MHGTPDEGFERFVAEHRDAVSRYARRRVGDGDAADVVADTFAVAWRRWDVAQRAGLPWLYRTAGFHVQTLRRGQARRERLDDRLGGLRGREGEASDVVVDRMAVAAALADLGDADRELLQLAYWEDLAVADLAAVLGCTTATAAVRLHRARRRLRTFAVRHGLDAPQAHPDRTEVTP